MYSEELELIVRQVRTFVRDVVIPAEQEIEEADELPAGIIRQAKDMGLYGFALPTEHGGLGLTASEEVEVVFELGYTTPALRSQFGTNNGIAGHVLMEGGTLDQQRRWLPQLAGGDVVAAFALTEDGAGSDPSGLRTSGSRDGGTWVLNGSKRYITNAPNADVFMVFARTDPTQRGGRGISVFLVDAASEGLEIAPKDEKMGQRGAWTADVHLEDVRVSDENLIGGGAGEGEGYRIAMRCLSHGRLHIAALCVGMAHRLVDESVAYAAGRVQGGKVIGEHQLVQALIADAHTEMLAGEALVRQAARAFDAGSDTRVGPSAAKYYCSEMVHRVADRAVQVHGGAGYMRGVPVERFYRDARLFRIYEGTSQIQQLIIGGALIRAAGASAEGSGRSGEEGAVGVQEVRSQGPRVPNETEGGNRA